MNESPRSPETNPIKSRRSFLAVSGAAALGLTGCATSGTTTSDARFKKKYAGFRYSAVDPVTQSKQLSCGAAALTSVLNYWKEDDRPEFVEKAILKKYPYRSPEGYPLMQLREIAMIEGFAAFAVTLDDDPWKQLREHLDAGRPVITAVNLPRGRYYGKSIPLVETLDRRAVMTTGNEWKSHYVVAMGWSYEEVLCMDPKYGIKRVRRDDFLHFWKLEKNAALIVSSI